jgi:hypothetical protein
MDVYYYEISTKEERERLLSWLDQGEMSSFDCYSTILYWHDRDIWTLWKSSPSFLKKRQDISNVDANKAKEDGKGAKEGNDVKVENDATCGNGVICRNDAMCK